MVTIQNYKFGISNGRSIRHQPFPASGRRKLQVAKLRGTGRRFIHFAAILLFAQFIIHNSAFCQQPQAQSGQAIFPVNAKYVQGFGPGYWPTAGSNLTLNLAAGTALCSNVVQTYAGGTLTLAPSATNYVYLDPSRSCAPSSNTIGFATATIPIATVITASSTISSINDVRTLFVTNGVTSPGTVTSVGMTGDGIIYSPTVPGSPTTTSGTLTPQLLTQSSNKVLAGPGSGQAATPTFRSLVAGDLPATISSNTTGNAATATALASSPTQCGSSNWATGVSVTGNANCLQPGFSNLSGSLALGQTPLTTAGDLLFANSTPSLARLPIGGTNQFLGVSGGVPAWTQPTFSNLGGTAAISQGGTGQTSAAAAFNGLSPLSTEGDLHYYHSSSNTRLALGGANTFLTSNGTDPSWGALTGAGFGSQTANTILASPNGASGNPSFRSLLAADLPASITSSTSGNAATATALATAPSQCSGNNFATGVAASGNANCAQPTFANLSGTATNPQLPGSGATTVNGQSCTLNSTCNVNSGAAQYSVAVNGAASTALGGVAPSATSGVPLVSQGSSANPVFGTVAIVGGGTGQTTAATAFNALSPLTTEGDLHYYHSSSNTRLAVGGANTFLTSNGTDPSWGALTGAGFGSQTANTFLSAPNGSSGNPTFRTLAAADLPATLTSNTSGNAATATALAAAPSQCSGSTFALGVAASGNANCIGSQTANYVYAAPNGSSGAPTFRALAGSDLPTIGISGGGTGQTTASAAFNALSPLTGEGDLHYYHSNSNTRLPIGSNGQCLTSNGTDPVWETCGTGSGSVTSVGLSMPSIFSITGSPVTASGTLTASLATQNANLVLAGPSTGSAAAPGFRNLVGADLPAPTTGTMGGVEAITCNAGQFVDAISPGGAPLCGAPSGSGSPTGLGNGSTVIDATLAAGADFGVQLGNALAQAYAQGGGIVDGRGFACPAHCQIGTQDLVLGDGVHPVTVYLPKGTITRGELSSTGVSAKVYYRGPLTVWAYGATLSGASDSTALDEYPTGSAVSNVHIYGLAINDTSYPATAGSVTMQVGGPNPNGYGFVPTTGNAYSNNFIGNWAGYAAQFAVYNYALTASQVANHYSAGSTTGSGYETTVEGDSPVSFWPLTETSGTTATDFTSGRNGTYGAGVTVGAASGIPGQSGSKAVTLTTASNSTVAFPSYPWFGSSGSAFSVEGWYYYTASESGQCNNLAVFYSGAPNIMALEDCASSDGGFDVQITNSTTNPGALGVVTFGQNAMPNGQWVHLVFTYKNGYGLLYINGVVVRHLGTDVGNSTFVDMTASGGDRGVQLNSAHGCVCYNDFENISAYGYSVGWEVLNSSGYAFGVNANHYGKISVQGSPIGIYEGPGAGAKNVYDKLPDLEGNRSSTGAVIEAEVDALYPGSGYVVGDTVTGSGCTTQPTFSVTSVSSGQVTGVSVKTGGTGCSNTLGMVTTGGSGTGLELNAHTQGYLILNGSSTKVDTQYEEAGSNDYLCGAFNEVSGPQGSGNGSVYNPTYCPGATGIYGGPLSNFVWGAGATPNSIGLNGSLISPYVAFNNSYQYDPYVSSAFTSSVSSGINLFGDGPAFSGRVAQIYGEWGHTDWYSGVDRPMAGFVSHGLATVNQIANPSAPTLTAYGGTGTTSAAYGLVCQDGNNGHTAVPAPVTTVSGPATLGAWQTVTIAAGGSSYQQSDVGTHVNISGAGGYGSGGQLTITQVNNGSGSGPVTGISIYAAGSGYVTSPFIGGAYSGAFSTSASTGGGTGLIVSGTASNISVALPLTDGCRGWTVIVNDTAHALQATNTYATGSTNVSSNILDYGNSYSSVSWTTTRNTTGDLATAGKLTTANNTLDDGTGKMSASASMTAPQFCVGSNCITSLWSNPMTTLGDLLFEGSGGAATRLAGNTSTTPMYLKSVGASGVPTAPTLAQIQFTDIAGTLGIGAGGTGQSTAAAAFNALSPLTTEGDLHYYHSSSNTRLALGGANTFLTSNGTDPSWGALTGAGFGSQTANTFLAAPNGSSGNPSFRSLLAADLPASITSSTSGNAATATALATAPSQCSGNNFATGVAASGNANCAQPTFANLSGTATNPQLPGSGATTVNGQSCTLNSTCNVNSGAAQYSVAVNGAASTALGGVAPSATSGVPLVSQGSSANPVFGTVAIVGGGTGQTTAATAFNALSPLTTEGDLHYYHSSSNTRLALGGANTFLTSNGTDPSWGALTGAGFGSQTANTFLAAPNGSSGNPTFRTLAAADLPATLTSNTSGNAATATALAATPTQCGSSSYATGIAASGNANCGTFGFPTRAVSGTTDTIVAGDNGGGVNYNGSGNVSVTLPTATTLGNSKFSASMANATSGSSTAVTVSATSWQIYTNGGNSGSSSLTLSQGQSCFFMVDPSGSAWDALCREPQVAAGSNITLTRSATGLTITANPLPNVSSTSNVLGQTASQGTVTLAASPTAGSYRINIYADQYSGSGSTYFTFNWTDGSTARSLTTGLLTLSGGYLSGLFPIYVGGGNVTYTSTVAGTVNYDVHITLERMQ